MGLSMSPKVEYRGDIAYIGGKKLWVPFSKKMYPGQYDAFYPKDDSRFRIIEASTKAGKSVGALMWMIDRSTKFGGVDRPFVWVSPVYSQAKVMYRRALSMFRDSKEALYLSHNDSELAIVNRMGSRIIFKSGEHPDSLYGDDCWAAVLDECSRMREEAWHAVRSTLTYTEGPAVMIGNVKGRKNWFYGLARRAEMGEEDLHYAKLTAYDAIKGGVLSEKEVEAAKRILPEAVFQELYMAEPSDDQGNPFGYEHINACITESMSPNDPVAYGIDLAKSRDWTCIIGVDADWNVCRYHRFQRDWEPTKQVIEIECAESGVPVLIDSTGVGDPIVEDLSARFPNVEGFKFTSNSKQQLMELLMTRIQRREIGFPGNNEIVAELHNFGYTLTRTGVKYEAMSGTHDDTVMALALACKAAGETPGWGIW